MTPLEKKHRDETWQHLYNMNHNTEVERFDDMTGLRADLFEIYECGDPYSRAWDCSQFARSFDEPTCTYRGDISGRYDKRGLIMYLRRQYPGCVIRYRDSGRLARIGQ